MIEVLLGMVLIFFAGYAAGCVQNVAPKKVNKQSKNEIPVYYCDKGREVLTRI